MFKPEFLRIARRLIILTILVVCLGVAVFSPGVRKTTAIGCCSPCFNCYDSCDQLTTPEEVEACYARCQRTVCSNPYCDPNC